VKRLLLASRNWLYHGHAIGETIWTRRDSPSSRTK